MLALKDKSPAVSSPSEPATTSAAKRAIAGEAPDALHRPARRTAADVPLPVGVLPPLCHGEPARGKTHGGLHPDGRERRVRREQQRPWQGDRTGLQNGVPYNKFVKQFAKVNCISAIKNPSSEGHSCADVVGRCIELSAKNQSIATLNDWNIRKNRGAAPLPRVPQPAGLRRGLRTRGSASTAAGPGAVDPALFNAHFLAVFSGSVRLYRFPGISGYPVRMGGRIKSVGIYPAVTQNRLLWCGEANVLGVVSR